MPALLFALPCAPDEPRGNVTTARRIARGLVAHGWLSGRCDARTDPADWPSADVVVALHAANAAPQVQAACDPMRGVPTLRGRPFLVMFTGTDLVAEPAAAARNAVASSAAAVALGTAARAAALASYPEPAGGIHLIRQGLEPLPESAAWPPGVPPLEAEDELLLLPCGVRAVKDPARAVRALAPLAATRPRLRLWIAGPEMEGAAAAELREAILRANVGIPQPWVRWLGAVPREQLRPLVQHSRLVLSSSHAEGGAPNALLEAAECGVPVLASDISAHRDFPGAAQLFGDDAELRARTAELLDDPHGAQRLGEQLRAHALLHFNAAAEARSWDALLRRHTPVTARSR